MLWPSYWFVIGFVLFIKLQKITGLRKNFGRLHAINEFFKNLLKRHNKKNVKTKNRLAHCPLFLRIGARDFCLRAKVNDVVARENLKTISLR